MEIQDPEEYRDQPVIDIEVEFVGGAQNAWTINDEPDNQPFVSPNALRFRFIDTDVVIERRNLLWWGVRERIARIPVEQNGAPTQASQQPEGGGAGDSNA